MADEEIEKDPIPFLLAEYKEINDEKKRLRDEGLTRLNFFITLTTSILGGLVIVNGIASVSNIQFQIIAFISIMLLLVVGWGTFRFSIHRDFDTDDAIRSITRIRRYFINTHPTLKEYLPEQNDEPTGYITGEYKSNLRTTMQLLVSALFGLEIGLLLNLIFHNITISLAGCLAGLVLALVGMAFYTKKQFRDALEFAKGEVRFPLEENTKIDNVTQTEKAS